MYLINAISKILHSIFILVCFLIIPILHSFALYALDVSPEEYEIIKKFEELKTTDLTGAENYLHESLKAMRTPSLLYQAALIEMEKNRISKAAEFFTEVIDLDPVFSKAYLNRGRLNVMLGNDLAGVNDLLEGIKVDGADIETMKLLSNTYHKLDQPIAGEQVLRWAILTKPVDWELHLQLAYNLLQQNRFGEADKVAVLAIRYGCTDINAWTIRAHAAIEANNIDKAIDILVETQLYHDNLADDHYWLLGELYLRQGFIQEASNIFRESHRKKPLHNKKLITFLETLISLEALDELDTLSSKFREAEPNNAKASYYCAYACQLKGDLINATELAKQATELNAGFGEAYILLGKLYSRAQNSAEALNNLKIARSFPNVKLQALQLELELWMQDEKWAEALEVLDMLSQLDPNNSWTSLISSITAYVQE